MGKVFNYTDYSVNIFSPYNNQEDFIVTNVGDVALKLAGNIDKTQVLGRLYSKVFPYSKKLGILDILKRVYKTGDIEKYIMLIYKGEETLFSIESIFLKEEDSVLFLARNELKKGKVELQERILFDTANYPLLIIQNSQRVKFNEAYIDMMGGSKEELLTEDFNFGKNRIYDFDVNLLEREYDKVLHNNEYSFSEDIKLQIADGSFNWFNVYAKPVIFRDSAAVQVSYVDITKQKFAENQALILKEDLEIVGKLTKSAIMHGDKVNGDNVNHYIWTSGIYDILGQEEASLSPDVDVLGTYVIDEEKDKVCKIISDTLIKHKNFDLVTKINTNDGIKDVRALGSNYIKDGENQITGFMQDISEQVALENQLKDFVLELTKTNNEKDILLKEVHHRIKNNLQIILSLINLDTRFNQNSLEKIIEDTKKRISAMALIHQKIYQSDNLSEINAKDYILDMAHSLLALYQSPIKLHNHMEDLYLDMDIMIPIGLIVNEILNNIIKYAFPNGGGNVSITLKTIGNECILLISDDGIGLPDDLDIYDSPSLGFTIINNLTDQIDGEFTELDLDGTALKIVFPLDNN